MFTVSTHSERSTLSCKGLGALVIDTSSPPLAGGTGSTRRARARRALKFRVCMCGTPSLASPHILVLPGARRFASIEWRSTPEPPNTYAAKLLIALRRGGRVCAARRPPYARPGAPAPERRPAGRPGRGSPNVNRGAGKSARAASRGAHPRICREPGRSPMKS